MTGETQIPWVRSSEPQRKTSAPSSTKTFDPALQDMKARHVDETHVTLPSMQSARDKLVAAKNLQELMYSEFDKASGISADERGTVGWDEKKCVAMLEEMGYKNPEIVFSGCQFSTFENRLAGVEEHIEMYERASQAVTNVAFRNDLAKAANLEIAMMLVELEPLILWRASQVQHGIWGQDRGEEATQRISDFEQLKDAHTYIAYSMMCTLYGARVGDGDDAPFAIKPSKQLNDAYAQLTNCFSTISAAEYRGDVKKFYDTYRDVSERQLTSLARKKQIAGATSAFDKAYIVANPYVEALIPVVACFALFVPGGQPIGMGYFALEAKRSADEGNYVDAGLTTAMLMLPFLKTVKMTGEALVAARNAGEYVGRYGKHMGKTIRTVGTVGEMAGGAAGLYFTANLAGFAGKVVVDGTKYGFTEEDTQNLIAVGFFGILGAGGRKPADVISGARSLSELKSLIMENGISLKGSNGQTYMPKELVEMIDGAVLARRVDLNWTNTIIRDGGLRNKVIALVAKTNVGIIYPAARTIIGRNHNKFLSDDRYISRDHGIVELEHGTQLKYTDISTNGTTIISGNGKTRRLRNGESTYLETGDAIYISPSARYVVDEKLQLNLELLDERGWIAPKDRNEVEVAPRVAANAPRAAGRDSLPEILNAGSVEEMIRIVKRNQQDIISPKYGITSWQQVVSALEYAQQTGDVSRIPSRSLQASVSDLLAQARGVAKKGESEVEVAPRVVANAPRAEHPVRENRIQIYTAGNYGLADGQVGCAITQLKGEDTVLGFKLENRDVVIGIFDGMGGHGNGDAASQTAAKQVGTSLAQGRSMEDALKDANSEVFRQLGDSERRYNPGTTATVAVISPDGRVNIGHVGDSRAYVVRANGKVQQITTDQSALGPLGKKIQDAGGDLRVLNETELSMYGGNRHYIGAYIGNEKMYPVTIETMALQPGDRLVIVSDGIGDVVTNFDVRDAIKGAKTPEEAAKALVNLAETRSADEFGLNRYKQMYYGKEDDRSVVVYEQK